MYNKNAWKSYSKEDLEKVMSFAEGYKDFISKGKTERECVNLGIKIAEEHGYKNIKDCNWCTYGNWYGIYWFSYFRNGNRWTKKNELIIIYYSYYLLGDLYD